MPAPKKASARKTTRSSSGEDLFAAPKKATATQDTKSVSPKTVAASAAKPAAKKSYSAKDIEVLEGLEPVRRRPGMYIGGDNSMDEAVAGHASWIDVELMADGSLRVADNGRGIPTDPHPKFKNKSALEVIMTTLHAGGKFGGDAYETSGGLHGVGVSVVNALSDELVVEVARDQELFEQRFSKGLPKGGLKKKGAVKNRRGTAVTFHPDPEIFGAEARFKPARLYKMARSKAYLYGGVEIRWSCDPSLVGGKDATPDKDVLHFPNGLVDFLAASTEGLTSVTAEPFTGRVKRENGGHGGRLNGRSAGTIQTAFPLPIVIRCQRRKVARTKRACAPR